ncbi:hypothetical protein RJ641_018864 [Dillenia turbinata]|uniref:Alcohol dehydrogenase-like C-terminal domain-containing protein n=1 Tax=Dillenia turbinata TaxID=194707 RepID=A0AAN8UU96_9MAGN
MVAAGALPVAFGTSHVALIHRAHLRAGQVLLVLGAAGGVGLSAVQIGKISGAIASAITWLWALVYLFFCFRGAEKVKLLKSIAVDHVVDSSHENVIESVKEFLKTRKLKGVDVLFDPVGGKITKDSMKLLKWGAHIDHRICKWRSPCYSCKYCFEKTSKEQISQLPRHGGARLGMRKFKQKNWTVHGLYWGSYKIHRPGVLEDSLNELLSWLAKGLITVNISHAYPLWEANLGFSAIKNRKVIGKVMMVFDDKSTARSKL